MQSAIETGKNTRLGPSQMSRLFSFEAEYSKAFSERTVVPPAIMENPFEVTSQLTDDLWLIINGEKGSGKTSYLYYTRHELETQTADENSAIPLYIAFDSDDVKFEINSIEEKTHFLVSYFYEPLVQELGEYLNSIHKKPKEAGKLFTVMVGALGLTQKDLRVLFPTERRIGFIAWLLRVLGISPSDNEESSSESSHSRIGDQVNSGKGKVDYSAFRDALLQLADSLGNSRVYLLIDEVNEQRLSRSQQQTLFDHLYNTYRTVKERITIKIATTSSVELPDFIFHGHYFMPMELSSMLLHPFGYEEMLRSILELRLKAIYSENNNAGAESDEADKNPSVQFSDFFTENAFHALAQASMGNVREFFFLSKMAYNNSLPEGKIEYVHAQRVIRSRASELEQRVSDKGGDSLYSMYLHLVYLLKERSESKAARQPGKKSDSPLPSGESGEEINEAERSETVASEKQDKGAKSGVSYFMISDYDALSREQRGLIDKLEDEKIIFGTGEWKSLRRKGDKQQMFAISYPVCMLRGIQWYDVSSQVRLGAGTERELIDQNRCQIKI